MILAHALGGWEAIRGPGPISWLEAQLSLQHLSEERVGAPLRLARAVEDKAAAAQRTANARGRR